LANSPVVDIAPRLGVELQSWASSLLTLDLLAIGGADGNIRWRKIDMALDWLATVQLLVLPGMTEGVGMSLSSSKFIVL
jgi:hypothetical protein